MYVLYGLVFVAGMFTVGLYITTHAKKTQSVTKEIEIAHLLYEEEEVEPLILNDADVRCLALAIFHEARGDTFDGKTAVANVVMNRVERGVYARGDNNICGVVFNGCQFTFACTRLKHYDPGKSKNSVVRSVWDDVQDFARNAMLSYYSNGFIDITNGATYFHAPKVRPNWRKKVERVGQIGAHIFYRKDYYGRI
jgi:spore germination cell wall hydrolase CwlJ-like protein